MHLKRKGTVGKSRYTPVVTEYTAFMPESELYLVSSASHYVFMCIFVCIIPYIVTIGSNTYPGFLGNDGQSLM